MDDLRRKEEALLASMNRCTCGESKDRCPVHEPEQAMTAQECPVQAQADGRPLPLQDAGDFFGDGLGARGRRIPTGRLDPNAPSANDRQVGGSHYKRVYQHWDFVTDVNLHYLIGCASKYVLRHQDKNGMQDLEKCIHYLDKAEERDVHAMEARQEYFEALIRFAAQLPEKERRAVECMCMSNYVEASCIVRDILNELKGVSPQ